MRSAIYIENGLVQLVLTPDNDFEKNALGSFREGDLTAVVKSGSFYRCQGGWVRHGEPDNSLIIINQSPDLLAGGGV